MELNDAGPDSLKEEMGHRIGRFRFSCLAGVIFALSLVNFLKQPFLVFV